MSDQTRLVCMGTIVQYSIAVVPVDGRRALVILSRRREDNEPPLSGLRGTSVAPRLGLTSPLSSSQLVLLLAELLLPLLPSSKSLFSLSNMGFKTEAFLLDSVNADFKLREIELDDPLPNEVIVEISACGLCHTDCDCVHFLAFMISY